ARLPAATTVVAGGAAGGGGASGPAAAGGWAWGAPSPARVLRSTSPACELALARPPPPLSPAPGKPVAAPRVRPRPREGGSPVDRQSPLNHRWMAPLRIGFSMSRYESSASTPVMTNRTTNVSGADHGTSIPGRVRT